MYDLGYRRKEPSCFPYKMRKFSRPPQRCTTDFVLQKAIKWKRITWSLTCKIDSFVSPANRRQYDVTLKLAVWLQCQSCCYEMRSEQEKDGLDRWKTKKSRRKLLHIFRKPILFTCSIYDRTGGLYRQDNELFQSSPLAEILPDVGTQQGISGSLPFNISIHPWHCPPMASGYMCESIYARSSSWLATTDKWS